MSKKNYPPTTWIKGHQLRWGYADNPSCTWCGTKKNDVTGFCKEVIPHTLKKIGNGLGYFLFVTLWNTIAGWIVLGLLWLILFLISGGTANVLMATNEDMLPGVPFWIVWIVVANILGWLKMLEEKFS